jgi:predicted acylesterase/phospholipase RssA
VNGRPSRRVHLLLSAGGIRCLAYIGALEQLEREGVEIATVSTCSAGTLVGALYCCGVPPAAMREAALNLDLRRLAGGARGPTFLRAWRLIAWPYAMYPEPGIPRVFHQFLDEQGLDPDPKLGELRVPLTTAALDVASKRLLVYSSEGNPDMAVAELLSIATAIPLVCAPHIRGDREILDASLASYAPVWLATGQPEDLPIVVLRSPQADVPLKKGPLPKWMNQIFTGAVASRDTFLLERMPKVSLYDIESDLSAFDFRISRSEVEELIESGRRTVAEAEERREEGSTSPLTEGGDDDRAQETAARLYHTHLDRVAKSRTATIFLSYAREDRMWVKRLRNRLGALVADPNVSVWDDAYIKPGKLWAAAVADAIARARVAVLFVSRNFDQSTYISETELPLLRAHVDRGCVLWVSIDGTQPKGPERNLQAVGNAKPLDSMDEADADRTLSELAHLVEDVYRAAVTSG